jgi:hypothetical protein
MLTYFYGIVIIYILSKETVLQSSFVIASDRRERGNLYISNAL